MTATMRGAMRYRGNDCTQLNACLACSEAVAEGFRRVRQSDGNPGA